MEYVDGLNVYEYVKSNPSGFKDAYGLQAGTAGCNKGTGKIEIKINNTKCTKVCTKEHEDKHKSQLKTCCQRVYECIKNKKASEAVCRKAYDDWFAATENEDECEAYKQSIACAKWQMFWRGCKPKCKNAKPCCKDFDAYKNLATGNKNHYCGLAGKRKPCPFGWWGKIK